MNEKRDDNKGKVIPFKVVKGGGGAVPPATGMPQGQRKPTRPEVEQAAAALEERLFKMFPSGEKIGVGEHVLYYVSVVAGLLLLVVLLVISALNFGAGV